MIVLLFNSDSNALVPPGLVVRATKLLLIQKHFRAGHWDIRWQQEVIRFSFSTQQ
jgi:hypothetical protein